MNCWLFEFKFESVCWIVGCLRYELSLFVVLFHRVLSGNVVLVVCCSVSSGLKLLHVLVLFEMYCCLVEMNVCCC